MARLVIVDDDERFRELARKVLECGGFRVVGEAGDGRTALAAARELRPDVVLLDVQLPDLDGLDVAARLASLDGLAVVLTSSRDEGDFGDALRRSGARGFVAKAELSAERIASLCE